MVFKPLAKLGKSLAKRRERFLEEKRKRLKQGDISYAYSWADVELVFRSILDKYKMGKISKEKAKLEIDKVVDYIARYKMMFELRGLGMNPEKKAWEIAQDYKALIEITPQKKPEERHYVPKVVKETKKHKSKKSSKKRSHKRSSNKRNRRKKRR